MKKISELTGDQFFDVIYILSPILPMITEMELIQSQLFGNHSKKIVDARTIIVTETLKLEEAMKMQDGDGAATKNDIIDICNKNIAESNKIIQAEISGIFARDISKIVPLLVSKENRGCIFETLAILENLPVAEIKNYSAPKLISRIKDVIKDADFKSFLSYAEESDATE